MKKALSLFLVVLMLVGMLPMVALNASAATTLVTYEKVTAAPADWSGTYVIVYEEGNRIFNGSLASLDAASNYIDVTITDSVVTTANLTNYEFTIAAMDGGYSIQAKSGKYIGHSSDANKLTSSDTALLNTLSINDDGSVNIICAGGAYLRYNATSGQDRFRYYKSTSYTSQKAICLYAKVETEVTCDHIGTTTTVNGAKDATCTAEGYTGDTVCSCGVTIATGEAIPALGHSYGDWTVSTAATCIAAGARTQTCATCGNVVTETIAATGHSYGEDGICATCGTNKADAVSYKEVTVDTITAGNYIIAGQRGATGYPAVYPATATCSSDWTVIENAVTVTDGVITSDLFAGAQVFVLTGDNTNGFTIGYNNGTEMVYLGISDYTNNRKLAFSADYSTVLWTLGTADKNGYSLNHAYTDADGNAANYAVSDNSTGTASIRGYKSGSTYYGIYLFAEVTDGNIETPDVCTHISTTTTTVAATCTEAGSTTVTCADCGETISTEEIAALGHSYVNNICTVCGTEFEGEIDTPDETEPTEEVKIIFELGADGSASHVDGSSATTYTETVGDYTLNITDGFKMYPSSIDATGNGCIKLGTGSAAGGFTFTVPSDVTQVIICVAKYKANTTKINVNGTDYTLVNSSNDGAYDEITVDTSSSKTVTVTTLSGGYRAMVNSIAYICGETDHTCEWDEGTVTKEATCTEDGVKTYSCTVDGCTKTMTETIKATGHSYIYTETVITCANCDYSAAYTLSTIAEAKAYTDAAQVYYVKGIVTYVSGKNVYIEDTTGAICVYFATADEATGIALGDEILVWDTMTTYNGLIETTNTTANEYVKVSSGNELPLQVVTIDALLADTTNEYLGERVQIQSARMGVMGTKNTAIYDDDNSNINIYGNITLDAAINEEDIVNVTAIVSTYNAYQLLLNPGTAAADVEEVEHHDPIVLETVEIATAKAGAAGDYYQVEGTVTYISGRNVYIQDATGGIVVYLTANAATTQVGDNVRAYGAWKSYNGLIELDSVDETNTRFYEILSSGNTVDAQEVTMAGLLADTTNEYLAEKVTINGVYVSHYSYNSSYKNVTYYLVDGNGNEISVYRVTVASEEECVAGGSIVNVEAVVSAYNGYQLVTTNDKITVVGTCAHETTELVNAADATCTEAGYTGDTMCTVCQNYTARGEEIAALGHTEIGVANSQPTCTEVGYTSGVYCTVCETYTSGHEEIPMVDHVFSGTITAPTCTEQGYTTYACYMCGLFDEISNYVAPLGHDYTGENGACSRCGAYQIDESLKFYQIGLSFAEYIGVQPMLLTSVVKNYDSFYVEAVHTKADGVVTTILEPTMSTSSYNVYDLQMLPRAMTDGVTLTIYAVKDGVTYCSEAVNTSITELALAKISEYQGKDDLGACKVLVDMLVYGAEVQKAFSYKTEDVPTDYLGEYAALGTTGTPTITGSVVTSGSGIRVYANSLSLGSKVEVQFMFKTTDVEGCKLVAKFGSETIEVSASEFDTTVMNGYSVAIFAMKPRNFRDTMTIAIYNADGEAVSAVYTASVENYANGALSKYPTLVPAMMNYGDAVLARFPG